MRRLIVATVVAVAVMFAAPAWGTGSGDPTPYTVSRDGLTFPSPLQAHSHINVRTADGVTHGLHIDPNNGHPGASWVGASFVPWSAFGITNGCVVWVQWSDTNEHFGEGGQKPVCLHTPHHTKDPHPCPTTPAPTPAPTPTATPTPESTASPTPTISPAPEPTVDPTEAPTASPAPDSEADTTPPVPVPSASSPSTSSTPTPSSVPSPNPAPNPTSTSAASSASPSPAIPSQVLSTANPTPTPTLTGTPELAATGVDGAVLFLAAVITMLVGLIAWGVGRNGGGAR